MYLPKLSNGESIRNKNARKYTTVIDNVIKANKMASENLQNNALLRLPPVSQPTDVERLQAGLSAAPVLIA